jgi:hypothetical protein
VQYVTVIGDCYVDQSPDPWPDLMQTYFATQGMDVDQQVGALGGSG